MTDENAMAAKLAGYWLCPRCETKRTTPDRHGWPSMWSPRTPNGSPLVVYCDEATDEEVARYKAWKALPEAEKPGSLVEEAKRTLAEWKAKQGNKPA